VGEWDGVECSPGCDDVSEETCVVFGADGWNAKDGMMQQHVVTMDNLIMKNFYFV